MKLWKWGDNKKRNRRKRKGKKRSTEEPRKKQEATYHGTSDRSNVFRLA